MVILILPELLVPHITAFLSLKKNECCFLYLKVKTLLKSSFSHGARIVNYLTEGVKGHHIRVPHPLFTSPRLLLFQDSVLVIVRGKMFMGWFENVTSEMSDHSR